VQSKKNERGKSNNNAIEMTLCKNMRKQQWENPFKSVNTLENVPRFLVNCREVKCFFTRNKIETTKIPFKLVVLILVASSKSIIFSFSSSLGSNFLQMLGQQSTIFRSANSSGFLDHLHLKHIQNVNSKSIMKPTYSLRNLSPEGQGKEKAGKMVAAAKSEMHFAFGPRSGHKGGWHGSRNALSAHCRTHKKDYCRNSILMRSKEGDDYDYDYDDDDDNGNGDEDTRTHPN